MRLNVNGYKTKVYGLDFGCSVYTFREWDEGLEA